MEGLGVGLAVEVGLPFVTACVVCVLRIALEIGCSTVGELVGCQSVGELGFVRGVCICWVVWVLCVALFSVGVKVCEGHCLCICDGPLYHDSASARMCKWLGVGDIPGMLLFLLLS